MKSHLGQVPRTARFVLILAALVVAAVSAWACDTPVYRYAMYNWSPHPYYVVYLYRGEIAEADREVNQALSALVDAPKVPLNLEVLTYDLDDPIPLEEFPDPVRLVLRRHEQDEVPKHIVISPQAGEIFDGRLTLADVAALTDSPARQVIRDHLDAGAPSVLVILYPDGETSDPPIRPIVEEVVRRAAQGQIEPDQLGVQPGEEAVPPLPFELGVVEVRRDDLAEAWLVRMLLDVEPDLAERTEPMVFAIYGRARAMPPYIGRGISADNLAECLSFVIGACSCQVKEQNPGLDLMVQADWEATAVAMAGQNGDEAGNETFLEAALLGSGGDATSSESTQAEVVAATASAETSQSSTLDESTRQETPATGATPTQIQPLTAITPASTSEPAAMESKEIWLPTALIAGVVVIGLILGTLLMVRRG